MFKAAAQSMHFYECTVAVEDRLAFTVKGTMPLFRGSLSYVRTLRTSKHACYSCQADPFGDRRITMWRCRYSDCLVHILNSVS
mmetsp:Transcript_124950/g.229317  ORF Transcript_124950/g.229317 Transcript_124950/m.229317 type:complete len:83 (+) Transcript_124950:94-342(+)